MLLQLSGPTEERLELNSASKYSYAYRESGGPRHKQAGIWRLWQPQDHQPATIWLHDLQVSPGVLKLGQPPLGSVLSKSGHSVADQALGAERTDDQVRLIVNADSDYYFHPKPCEHGSKLP